MKQQLLLCAILGSCIGFAQAPITDFINTTQQNYAILDAPSPIDQSASGENAVWSFTNFTQIGTNTDTYVSPAPSEVQSEYPGTTEIQVITTDVEPPVVSNLYIKNDNSEISITGLRQGEQLGLNITNNATLGTFPLVYPYMYADPDGISGTFEGNVDGTEANGTFTGTITTSVDGYGTLTLNDFGLGAYSGSVTRLKTEQTIDLYVDFFGFPVYIGDVVQTVHNYYDDTDGSLVFRTSENVFDIDAGGQVFQDTVLVYEAQDRSTLSIDNAITSNDFLIYPNPVETTLNIKIGQHQTINMINIMDLNGRTVITTTNGVIDVTSLQSGLYVAVVDSNVGKVNKKFIKR